MRRDILTKAGYGFALTATSILGITPLVLAPVIGPELLLLVPLIVGIILYRAYSIPQIRPRILAIPTMAAFVALATSLIVRNLPPFTMFEIPTPNIIARVFQLDGEAASDAGFYELWCEIWLGLSLSTAIAWRGIKRDTINIRRGRDW